MPKVKTSRAAAKRFKLTKTGRLKRAKAGKSHLLTRSKNAKNKRFLRTSTTVKSAQETKTIKKICPYL